jgi:hypothetical protein
MEGKRKKLEVVLLKIRQKKLSLEDEEFLMNEENLNLLHHFLLRMEYKQWLLL